jgi:zinc protease
MYQLASRFTAILALLLVGLVPAQAQKLDIKETVLPNGLKVLTLEDHTAPVVSFAVWYRVGSRNEHTGITGSSHLLEHMMFKGTKEYRVGEISRTLYINGALNNAATYFDWTQYWETIAADRLELAMQVESSRMTGSLIDAKEMASEMTVVRSELEGNENDPATLLNQAVWATAYMAHPYQWPVIGWRSDVEHVGRDRVYEYYRRYYGPNNATAIIIGDFETPKALQMVRRYFGKLPRIPDPPKVYTQEPPQRGERRVTVRREGSLPMVMLGFHVPSVDSPDMYALDVIGMILSSGRSGRLYQKLVENQLAVGVNAGAPTLRDPSLFLVSATARPGGKNEEVEKALTDELERLKTEPVTAEELQRAVSQLEADYIYSRESVTTLADRIGYWEATKDWRYYVTYLDEVRKVTPAIIQRVATQYFTADNRTAGWFVPTAGGGRPSMGGPPSEAGARLERAGRGARPLPLPKPSPPPAAKRQITRVVLANGIVLLVQENRGNPTVALHGSLKGGGAFDPANRPGLAQMTAGLLDRGTESRSSLQIATALESVAANLSYSADTEAVQITGQSLKKDLGRMLDLLGDTLRRPSFPAAELEKLRQQALAGLEQARSDPDARATRAFERAVYPAGHPWRPSTLEEEEASLKAMTRDELTAFYRKHYGPDSLILAISGDLTAAEARAAVEKVLGDWTRNPGAPKLPLAPVPLQAAPAKEIITIPERSEVAIIYGFAGQLKRSDPDFYAAQVMNMILGGGGALSSRLGDVIRDQEGLVYDVASYFDSGISAGPWRTTMGTNPENVDRAVASLNRAIQEFLTKGVTQREVDEAVAYLTGSFPIRYRLETNTGLARMLHTIEYYGLGLDYIEKYPGYYRAVTIDQVREAALKHLHPERATLVIAGTYGGK